MVEIVPQRVESDFLVRFLCVLSVLSICEVNFEEDFVHQVTRITSRCQACFNFFNVFLKHDFRRVCPQELKGFSFNEAFFDACWVVVCSLCTEMFQ